MARGRSHTHLGIALFRLTVSKWIGSEPLRLRVVSEPMERLTERERAIIACIARGMTTKVMARELNLSPRAVEREVEVTRHKLSARDKSHLVALAYQAGEIQV